MSEGKKKTQDAMQKKNYKFLDGTLTHMVQLITVAVLDSLQQTA